MSERWFLYDDDWYDGIVLGYWGDKPIVISDGSGVAFPQEREGLTVNCDGGKYFCKVEEGKWNCNFTDTYIHSELEFEGNDEIAEETGYNVGWR